MQIHEQFMQRALDLALLGHGRTSPNPMVGCVIVLDNNIIGEGYHEQFGMPHAEVNAILSINEKALISQSTAYVTLEPCSHHGKTPPCAELLIKHDIKQVIVGSLDPNPQVSGRGIQLLKQAGIKVSVGILEKECMWLNRRFFVNNHLLRPYIILKWANTADGFLARENYDSKWISNQYSRKLVHKWRSEEDAIMVGKNTVLHDNPSLTTRLWQGDNPTRVVIDRHLELEQNKNVFNNEVPTIIFNTIKNKEEGTTRYIKIIEKTFLQDCIKQLYLLNIGSVIVEGGATILNLLIEAGLWDEARVFTAKHEFGSGIKAPVLVKKHEETSVMGDVLSVYLNPKSEKVWQKS